MGELLQPGGIAALHKLGLAHCLDGIDAARVEGYCIVNGSTGELVAAPYPDLERVGEMMGEKGGVEVTATEKHELLGSLHERRGAQEGIRRRRGVETPDGSSGSSDSASDSATGASTPPSSVYEEYLHDLDSKSKSTLPIEDDISVYGPYAKNPWNRPSVSGRKEGRSFHHGRLISSLRRACLSAGPNLVVLEATVKDLVRCEHTERVIGVRAGFKIPSSHSSSSNPSSADPEGDGEKITIDRSVYAPLTIIADGCFSKFRSTPGSRIPKPETRSHFVGVILKDADMPMKYHGTVSLTPAGPVLMYQIGDKAEETRMLVDVKGKLPSVADGSLKVSYILVSWIDCRGLAFGRQCICRNVAGLSVPWARGEIPGQLSTQRGISPDPQSAQNAPASFRADCIEYRVNAED